MRPGHRLRLQGEATRGRTVLACTPLTPDPAPTPVGAGWVEVSYVGARFGLAPQEAPVTTPSALPGYPEWGLRNACAVGVGPVGTARV